MDITEPGSNLFAVLTVRVVAADDFHGRVPGTKLYFITIEIIHPACPYVLVEAMPVSVFIHRIIAIGPVRR